MSDRILRLPAPVPAAHHASIPAPTQSHDSVRTRFDDTITELATPIADMIEKKASQANGKPFNVAVDVTGHDRITPQVVAVKAAALAQKNGVTGRFVSMTASNKKGHLTFALA